MPLLAGQVQAQPRPAFSGIDGFKDEAAAVSSVGLGAAWQDHPEPEVAGSRGPSRADLHFP